MLIVSTETICRCECCVSLIMYGLLELDQVYNSCDKISALISVSCLIYWKFNTLRLEAVLSYERFRLKSGCCFGK